MAWSIKYNEEKNQLLKATRGICFEDAVQAIKEGNLLANLHHLNPKYPHQKLLVVKIAGYIYAVPYLEDTTKQEIFLKTVYPSRVLNKKYQKRGQ